MDRPRLRRPRAGRVLAWVVIGWVILALAWTLAVRRDGGTFESQRIGYDAPAQKGCHAIGRWVSDDGSQVVEQARLDGQCLRPGLRRPATRYRAVGPWSTPGDARTVHERGAPLVAVLGSLAVLVVAGTYLVVTGEVEPGAMPDKTRGRGPAPCA